MNKQVCGAVVVSILVFGGGAAKAADLSALSYKAPVAALPTYNWTGCYVGAQAGGGTSNDSFALVGGGGGLAGGQLGCNVQLGQIVLGLEGEAAWSGLSDKLDFSFPGFSQDFTGRNRWSADLAARAGVAVDRALIFGKAGFAQGRFDFAFNDSLGGSETASGTLNGLLLGGGIEYAFAPNWSAKLEYDHIDYVGRALQFNTFFNGLPNGNFTLTQSASVNLVKLGVNYRFGGAELGPAIDPPARPPAYKAPASTAAHNWSGCYLGAAAGGGTSNDSFTPAGLVVGGGGGGGLAGGQLGCNLQLGQVVLSLEGEAAWSGLSDKSDIPSGGLFSQESTGRNRWSADLAARAGVAVDRALIFGKAGFAQGRFDFAENDSSGDSQTASGALNGLLLGAGIEYAFAPNWSAKLEYDHIDYVARTLQINQFPNLASGLPAFSVNETQSASVNLVKAGVNYRFGGSDQPWPAVPARPTLAPARYDWTGCYLGAAAGGGTSNDSFTTIGLGGGGGGGGGGGLAGGQLGCNVQFGQIVLGLEGEAVWAGLSDKSGFSHVDFFRWNSPAATAGAILPRALGSRSIAR
jgi:outer membrane immunogenic protein